MELGLVLIVSVMLFQSKTVIGQTTVSYDMSIETTVTGNGNVEPSTTGTDDKTNAETTTIIIEISTTAQPSTIVGEMASESTTIQEGSGNDATTSEEMSPDPSTSSGEGPFDPTTTEQESGGDTTTSPMTMPTDENAGGGGSDNSPSGLSDGEIVGIVFGSVAGGIVLVGVVYYFIRRPSGGMSLNAKNSSYGHSPLESISIEENGKDNVDVCDSDTEDEESKTTSF